MSGVVVGGRWGRWGVGDETLEQREEIEKLRAFDPCVRLLIRNICNDTATQWQFIILVAGSASVF